MQSRTIWLRVASVGGAAALAIATAGCTSMMTSLLHAGLSASTYPTWSVQVNSATPPYEITLDTMLHGEAAEATAALSGSMRQLASGTYQNWVWAVKAPPKVLASWNIWRKDGANFASLTLLQSSRPARVAGWATGMQRLYSLTQFMLGEQPLPMRADITLVPYGHSAQLKTTQRADDYVPIVLAAWYFEGKADDTTSQAKRFHDLRETLAAVGGLLEGVELARGVTKAPTSGDARRIKSLANVMCFRIAARTALAAGSSSPVTTVASDSGGQQTMLAAAYQQSPGDIGIATLYATVIVTNGINQFLEARGLDWPARGTDIRGINAMLSYCNAFLQYPGDVRRDPMPLSLIKDKHFFSTPTHAQARKGISHDAA